MNATSRGQIRPGESVVLINGSGERIQAVYQGVDCTDPNNAQAVYYASRPMATVRIATSLSEQTVVGDTVTHGAATYNYARFDGSRGNAPWPTGENLKPRVIR